MIVVVMEQDIEVVRHHISMAKPFGDVCKWYPNQMSAYDMFDTYKPDMVFCSHTAFDDKGFSDYIYKYKQKCLVRYEAEGDVLAPHTISYTRYQDKYKQFLPACADTHAFKPLELERSGIISFKNYVGDGFLAQRYTKELLKKYKKTPKKDRVKVFRAYNVKTEWSCGDLSDQMLCEYVNRASLTISHFHKREFCLTSDVFNSLYCGTPVKLIFDSPEQQKFIHDSDMITELPPFSTNIDRARQIKGFYE